MNLFTLYRIILSILTGVELVLIFNRPGRFRRLYAKLPGRVRRFLRAQSMSIVIGKVKEARHDLLVNGSLLVLLLSLNAVLWLL